MVGTAGVVSNVSDRKSSSIGTNLVYDVRARKAFGFTKGDTFSETRWRF